MSKSNVIEGRVVNCNVNDTKNAKPFWDRVKETAQEAKRRVGKGVEMVGPAVKAAALQGIEDIDDVLLWVNKEGLEFLIKHPGIAMTLSPQTTVRMAVAQHVKDMTADSKADATDVVVANQ